jgi:membrane associated rhomboid family serine protease
MGLDVVVVLMCSAMWALHGVRLARAPIRQAWPAFVIVALGAGTTGLAFWLARPAAAHVAIAGVVGLLILPAMAVRSASRALRFGQISRARGLARLAVWLRPLPIQRRFRRAVEISWKLSRGEDVDLEEAIGELGVLGPVERAAHRVALLSWTNDYAAMANGLADAKVMAFALRAGMAAIVTSVTGETGTVAELVRLYRKLAKTKGLSRRTLDSASTLTAMAAYLGDEKTVEGYAAELRRDLPLERVAFMMATAQQRAGDADAAARTIDEAMKAESRMSVSGRERLVYRGQHPLEPVADHERQYAQETIEDVRSRLAARQALAPLGLHVSRRAPLTWAMTALLAAVFVWQSSQSRRVVFDAWGLVAPYAEKPDPWRMLTYAMLHVDVGHLLVNVVGLVIFGRFVEEHFGRSRWLLIYVAGALAGGAAFLWFTSALGVAIGASGAVLALFGATVARIGVDRPLRQSAQGRREVLFLMVIAAGQLVGDLLIAESSGSAHAGGFLMGLVLAAYLTNQSEDARQP